MLLKPIAILPLFHKKLSDGAAGFFVVIFVVAKIAEVFFNTEEWAPQTTILIEFFSGNKVFRKFKGMGTSTYPGRSSSKISLTGNLYFLPFASIQTACSMPWGGAKVAQGTAFSVWAVIWRGRSGRLRGDRGARIPLLRRRGWGYN